MLNPKHQRYADRLRELIAESETLCQNARSRNVGNVNYKEGSAWFAKSRNIIEIVFGEESAHSKEYLRKLPGLVSEAYSPNKVSKIAGVLSAALDDLEHGFLQGQEFIVAAEVFDSVLEQAKHLNANGYKDPAAVLGRVVLEDALKRMAREESIDDSQRAAKINDDLKGKGKYLQPQWRRIQAMLDVGNSAAHGNFAAFSQDDVTHMIDDIERFLAAHFGV